MLCGLLPNLWQRRLLGLLHRDLLGFLGRHCLHLVPLWELLRHRRHHRTGCMLRGDVLAGILHGVLGVRLRLLLAHGRVELRGFASRVGLSRLYNGCRGGRHVLAVDGAGGDAVQFSDVLDSWHDFRRREPVRADNELALGWINNY